MPTATLIWTIVSFLLTVLVLSYIIAGDNPLFRVATYIFIGATAAYVLIITFNQVIWPKFFLPLILPTTQPLDKLAYLAPAVLVLLLLAKLFPKLTRLGNVSLAYLVGAGAAVAIGGAVLGTLFPQGQATTALFDLHSAQSQGINPGMRLLEAAVVLVGTLATLFYFYYGARSGPGGAVQRNPNIELSAQIGKVFIAITFGSLFAGVFASTLTALIERLYYLWNFIF